MRPRLFPRKRTKQGFGLEITDAEHVIMAGSGNGDQLDTSRDGRDQAPTPFGRDGLIGKTVNRTLHRKVERPDIYNRCENTKRLLQYRNVILSTEPL
jgi:hypothetical protein